MYLSLRQEKRTTDHILRDLCTDFQALIHGFMTPILQCISDLKISLRHLEKKWKTDTLRTL